MLSRCANSQCLKPFLRLRQGRLFLVETHSGTKSGELAAPFSPFIRKPPRRVERYWLCDDCAAAWTLVHDRNQGIALVPIPQPALGAIVQNAEMA